MTHEEMIAVIQADKEEKPIEFKIKDRNDKWIVMSAHNFDFTRYDYRIKPEPHYRPFKSADEVMEAIREHEMVVVWKGDGNHYILVSFGDTYIQPYSDDTYNFDEALDAFTFADGTPFGKLEY